MNSHRPIRSLCLSLTLAIAACAATIAPASAQNIITFDFAGQTGNQVTNPSNFNDAGLTSSTISRGVGLTASSNADRFNATAWALTSIPNAVVGNNYMEFTITPNVGKKFSVSTIVVQWQRSATGNTAIALRSSASAYSTDIDGIKSVADITTTQTFTWNVTQADSAIPVTYRLYSYAEAVGGSGGPGDGTGNDIVVSGTVSNASATAPTITSFAPGSGVVGSSVIITGTNFNTATAVAFNGVSDPSFTINSPTQITATVPGGATTGLVSVTNPDGTGSSASNFTVTNPSAPTLSTSGTLTPFSTVLGTASAAQTFTVAGSNLTTDVTVTAPSSFEVASDALTFGPTATLLQSGGTASGTISARLAASAPAGSPSGNITVASTGATTVNVAASGTVTAPSLNLALSPTTVAENAGAGASTGTITATVAPTNDLTVTLTSGSPANATVPASVVIASNTTVQTFPIAAVPNPSVFANVPVLITASAPGYTNGAATLTVSNTDVAPIARISLTSTNTNSYTQNFDSLGTATISNVMSPTTGVQTSLGAVASTNLNGWYAAKIGGNGTNAFSVVADNGSGNSGSVYNYGSTNTNGGTNLNRSLGGLASASTIAGWGALIKNDTTNTLTSLSFTFTAKFWRTSTVTNNVLTFGFGLIGSTNATETNFITSTNGASPFPALNVIGPTPVGTNNIVLDGNLPANQAAFSNVALPITLSPGETAFVRWQDANETGNDAGLAIDDLSITAAVALAAPEFDLASGVYLSSQVVKVSNFASYGPGIEVRYTVDGSTPNAGSTLYNNTTGIAITDGNGTVVLQAIAIENPGSQTSVAATATYQLPQNVANLTALRASPTGSTIYRVTGQATFTAGTSFRNTKFFQDTAAGIQIDDPTAIITTVYTAGDNVQNFLGRISVFNGQLQMVPLQNFGAPVSTGNTVTPLARTLTSLSTADQAMLVTISTVTFQSAGGVFGVGGTTTQIKDPTLVGFTGVFQNIFGESNVTGAPIPGGPNTLTGIVQSRLVSAVVTLTVGPRNLSDIVFTGVPSLSIQSNKPTLVAGQTGEAAEAIVQVSRTGSTASPLTVDLTQSVASTFAADIDGSLVYIPLPTQIVIPSGSANVLAYVVALPNAASFNANFIASASGFDTAVQPFSIQGTGSGFTTWLNGAPTNSANVLKYAIGGATSPTNNDSIPSITTLSTNALSITAVVRTNDPSLKVFGQSIVDLAAGTWSSNGVSTNIPVDQTGVPSGNQRQIFSTPLGIDGKKFLRLQTTLSNQ
jgi:hypothetical protein